MHATFITQIEAIWGSIRDGKSRSKPHIGSELTSCVNREVAWALNSCPILHPSLVKPYGFCGRKPPQRKKNKTVFCGRKAPRRIERKNLVSELRNCVNREVAWTLNPYPILPPSLINHTVSVDVKHYERHIGSRRICMAISPQSPGYISGSEVSELYNNDVFSLPQLPRLIVVRLPS